MKKIILGLFLGIMIIPIVAQGQINNIENAGFVPGPIWFSKYPVFAGETVKIYTAIYNNSQYDIQGQVDFLNKGDLIDKVDFELPAEFGTKDIWANWEPEKGEAEIEVKINNVVIRDQDGQEINYSFSEEKQIAKNNIFVDKDNDNDGIGNVADEDDDNDGVSDLDEIKKGTDPFKVDHQVTPTNTPKEEQANKDNQEDSLLTKIDDSVMGFLGRVTKNKFDTYVEEITGKQVQVLENKKDQIKSSITAPSQEKLNINKSTTTLSKPDQSNLEAASPRDLKEAEVKGNISGFIKSFFSKAYLFILTVLIFILKHPVALFLTIFLLIYLIIRKIIRFFVY